MKTITPVQIWKNGQLVSASVLNSYLINDNLSTSATFWYGLFQETADGNIGAQLSQGNLTMTGADYASFETNLQAWDWVAKQLNLTIIGDYVAPVPPTQPQTA